MLITGAQVYQNHAFHPADLRTEGARILEIAPTLPVRAGEETLDGAGLFLCPGFIDIHTHGCAGVDVNAASADDYDTICRFEASQGVTGFHASVLTDTPDKTRWCLGEIAQAMTRQPQLLGAHLEGPFLAPEYKGAMPERLLRAGDPAFVRECQAASGGCVRYLTVSPEVTNAEAVIRAAVAEGVVVAIGHSGADYETSLRAIEAGATACTHTFNGMKLLHQHFPAILGAALESDIYCEAICDGRHLHPAIVRLLLKVKGYGRVVAITDSIMAAGLPDGQYRLGVNDVTVTDGDAKLTQGGTRAGSTLTGAQALRNLMRFTGAPMADVLPLLTENPARLMDYRRKGALLPDMDADMVLLTAAGEVRATICAGRVLYSHQG